jgi:hypothetical protein
MESFVHAARQAVKKGLQDLRATLLADVLADFE